VLLLPPLVMASLTQHLQGAGYRAHLERGGNTAPWWGAVLIGLFCSFLVFFGLAVHGALFEISMRDTRTLVVPGRQGTYDEIRYGKGITEEEAHKLVELLRAWDDVADGGGHRINLSRSRRRILISVVLRDGRWGGFSLFDALQRSRQEISQRVFAGHPVEVRLEHAAKRTMP
jgi:hypothetical protein